MHDRSRFPAIALGICLLVLAAPRATSQNNAVNLTSKFMKAGVRIDHLLVYSLSGIVVLRGSTSERSRSLDAYRYARKLGYKRIANLIQITAPPDDAAIVRSAERQLDAERSLGGCTFRIVCKLGVVQLTGRVQQDMQRDLAVRVVRRIDGVKEVHSTLSGPAAPQVRPRKAKA